MSIPDLHPEVELHAIKSGLRPEKFQETIAVAKPKTMAEFHEKAKGGGATSSARKRSYRAMLSINADQTQKQTLPQSPQIIFQTTDHDNSVANFDDPVDNTIATIHCDAREARECYNNSLKRPNRNTKAHVHNIESMNDLPILADIDPRAGTLERPTPTEDLFMDAYSGYNQIQMHPSDQNKTAFISENGNYCYKVMPFGLKNAGTTYQRLMDKVFAKQIDRNIEVYVNDMIAKTKIGNNHLDDLAEIFRELREYNMRLNPKKCAFGVQSGKFLGFMLTSRGIENAELRYPSIDKLALALVFSARRLRPYFQSHEIHVWTDHPLRQILQKPELAGRLVKWSVELSEFDIKYEGRASIKSQFLANFIAEFSVPSTTEDYIEWSLYVDGSSNPQECGAEQKPSLHLLRRMKGSVIHSSEREVCLPKFSKLDYIGRQYDRIVKQKLKAELKIKQHFSSVEHPQTNGLAEAANKVILPALRKKLDDAKGLWAELIPEIIWGYNITIHSTTKETPFRLVYSSDAMIPVEISQSSLRTELADQTTKDIAQQSKLDLIEELRSSTAVKHLAMQQHIARRYNQRLHPRSFQLNDLVLRKTEQARKPSAHGKLAANWEGPYRVTQVIGNGAYRLQTLEGKDLPNTWNVSSLKLYYS
ncbi:uncharacterized protein [Arachis hypogaea]|uniref:uncharacterized protein n=1 Tax=Arachis hypogaea TaxID=3818 RepID=UPI003B21ABAC